MSIVTTDLEKRLWVALKRITQYQSVESLRRYARRDYGIDGEEAVEYAYENVLSEAKSAIKGVRISKPKPDQ